MSRFPEVIAPAISTSAKLADSKTYPQVVGELAYATDTGKLYTGTDPAVGGSFVPVPAFAKSVTDAGPMTATAGIVGDMVFNTSDSHFYGCSVAGSPATWVILG
jgi:hypothetical protein